MISASATLVEMAASHLGHGRDDTVARKWRDELVQRVSRRGGPFLGQAWDPRVLAALGEVPRHCFVPGAPLEDVYQDAPYPIGYGQTISQPTVVAMMTQALTLDARSRVLEIGTGCGYQAAVMSRLAGEVDSIEVRPELAASARRRLRELGYANVVVEQRDGFAGWPERAPFDRIVLTAAPDELPPSLVEQLAEGGIIVAPIGPEHGTQRLVRGTMGRGRALAMEDLGAVMFVPMVHREPASGDRFGS